MSEISEKTCPYCDKLKYVKVWEETGEEVCFECRLDLLKQEFEETNDSTKKENISRETT